MPKRCVRKEQVRELSNETPMRESALQPKFEIIIDADVGETIPAPPQKKAKVRSSLVRAVTSY